MDQEPLVIDEIKAASEFILKLNEVLPINAAFWLKESDDGLWFLHLASDHVTYGNIGEGYGKVIQVSNDMPELLLDLLRVKLIPIDDPLAQAALNIYEHAPSNRPTRLAGAMFGGTSVDGVYLYPRSIMAPVSSPTS